MATSLENLIERMVEMFGKLVPTFLGGRNFGSLLVVSGGGLGGPVGRRREVGRKGGGLSCKMCGSDNWQLQLLLEESLNEFNWETPDISRITDLHLILILPGLPEFW